jgi:hypothetical protein
MTEGGLLVKGSRSANTATCVPVCSSSPVRASYVLLQIRAWLPRKVVAGPQRT